MKRSEEFAEIIKTIYETGNIIGKVKKDGTNPHYKSRYATLNSLLDAVEAPMEASKLYMAQMPEGENKLTTLIYHAPSGQWLEFTSEAPLAAQNAQGVGSLISYLRRYSIMSLFHLGTEDDDGNAASKCKEQPPVPAQQQPMTQQHRTPIWQQQSQQPMANYSQEAPPPPPAPAQQQPQKKNFNPVCLSDDRFVRHIQQQEQLAINSGKTFSFSVWLSRNYIITQEQLNQANNWYYNER